MTMRDVLPAKGGPAKPFPKRILLVDDDPDTLESLGQALRVLGGADVVTAPSGAQALAKLESGHPDAMVTDFKMPDMDGLELSKRAKGKYPRLAIVMITAFNSGDLERSAASAGVCEVVEKPPFVEGLMAAIGECYASTAR